MPFWENIVDMPNTKRKSWIVRNPFGGFYCGYVQVPESHPGFGVDDENWWHHHEFRVSAYLSGKRVHGGITFCQFKLVQPNDTRFLIGFDCGHAGDFDINSVSKFARKTSPNYRKGIRNFKTIDFARQGVLHLDRMLDVL